MIGNKNTKLVVPCDAEKTTEAAIDGGNKILLEHENERDDSFGRSQTFVFVVSDRCAAFPEQTVEKQKRRRRTFRSIRLVRCTRGRERHRRTNGHRISLRHWSCLWSDFCGRRVRVQMMPALRKEEETGVALFFVTFFASRDWKHRRWRHRRRRVFSLLSRRERRRLFSPSKTAARDVAVSSFESHRPFASSSSFDQKQKQKERRYTNTKNTNTNGKEFPSDSRPVNDISARKWTRR